MYVYVCICVFMYVCTYLRMYIHTYVCMYVCTYVFIYIHIYVHTYVCTHVYLMKCNQVHTCCVFCRLRILQNIGAVFVKMGQYSDAMTSYEHVMSEKPSVKAGQLCIVLMYVHNIFLILYNLIKF